jgi:hypothetical protein
MRKISLFAVAGALIVAGVGGWAASTTNARVATSTGVGIEPFQIIGVGIEPFQIMKNAKLLPAQHYDDFSLVFN